MNGMRNWQMKMIAFLILSMQFIPYKILKNALLFAFFYLKWLNSDMSTTFVIVAIVCDIKYGILTVFVNWGLILTAFHTKCTFVLIGFVGAAAMISLARPNNTSPNRTQWQILWNETVDVFSFTIQIWWIDVCLSSVGVCIEPCRFFNIFWHYLVKMCNYVLCVLHFARFILMKEKHDLEKAINHANQWNQIEMWSDF